MGQYSYILIDCKLKGSGSIIADKTDFKISKTNTDLIEYFTKILVNKEVRKNSSMLILLV